MNAREERGRAIAERCKIEPNGAGWLVPSQTGNGKYLVRLEAGEPKCSCPDYEIRQERCKHGWAVIITMSRVEQNADGSTTVSTVTVKAERKTYAQPDWSAYHAHQVNERRHFLQLLADLCNTIPVPPAQPNPKGGRSIPLRDAIYSAVYKVYSLTSARRFSGELAEAHERGYIGQCPHFNSVLNVFDNEETTPILRRLIQASAAPLAGVEVDFAVDSTGFATTSYTSWFEHKHGNTVERKRAKFVKAHFITGVVSNVVSAVEIHDQHANDSPQLPALVRATAETFTIRVVSGDAAYGSANNFAAVDKVSGTFFPAFKSNTTGEASALFAKAFHWFQIKKDDYLARYHKWSNIEATVSAVKRKFGDSVKSKNELAQRNEVYAKFVAHNLCVLIAEMYMSGLDAIFPAEPDNRPEPDAPTILRFPTRT